VKRDPLIYGGRVRDGVLHLDAPKLYRAAIKHFEGLRLVITIAPEEQRRSLRQQAYYRGVVLEMMARQSGHTTQELHNAMRGRYLLETVIDPISGRELTYTRSTADLTVAEFSKYLDEVMLLGAEWLGLSFPPPRRHEAWKDEAA